MKEKENIISFNKNELYNFINDIMQFKAGLDFREKRSSEEFTPAYHINEYINSNKKLNKFIE